MKNVSKAAVALVFLATIIFYALWYPHLPDMVPSRFGHGGAVNQQMARNSFVSLMGGITLGILVGFSILLPLLIRVMPISMINVPYREYYMSGDRRESTIAKLTDMVRWTAIVTALLLLSISHLSFEVATEVRNTISPYFGIAFTIYMLVVAILVIRILLDFRKPPEIEAHS